MKIKLTNKLKRIITVSVVLCGLIVAYSFATASHRYGVEDDKCSACGTCEAIAPEYFEIKDDVARPTKESAGDDGFVKEAQAACPNECIWTNY